MEAALAFLAAFLLFVGFLIWDEVHTFTKKPKEPKTKTKWSDPDV